MRSKRNTRQANRGTRARFQVRDEHTEEAGQECWQSKGMAQPDLSTSGLCESFKSVLEYQRKEHVARA